MIDHLHATFARIDSVKAARCLLADVRMFKRDVEPYGEEYQQLEELEARICKIIRDADHPTEWRDAFPVPTPLDWPR